MAHLVHELRVRQVLRQRADADEVSALHTVMVLRAGQGIALAGIAELQAGITPGGAIEVRST